VVTITEYLSHVESTLVGKFSCDWTDDKCGGDKLRAMWGMILTAVIISILLTAVETLILFTWAFDFCHVRLFTRPTAHAHAPLHTHTSLHVVRAQT
jgi:hypothetical protein